jgi:hypothetical protein
MGGAVDAVTTHAAAKLGAPPELAILAGGALGGAFGGAAAFGAELLGAIPLSLPVQELEQGLLEQQFR